MISQSALDKANPFMTNPAWRLHFPIRGVVVGIHFPADSYVGGVGNMRHSEIEYEVATEYGVLTNVPLAIGLHGVVDDQEYVLKAASTLIVPANTTYQKDTHGPLDYNDGDQVILQFINGVFTKPVITHVLCHTFRGATDDKMNARYKGRLELLTTGPTGGDGYVFGDGSAGKTAAVMKPTGTDRLIHHRINGTHLALDNNGDVFVNFKPHPDRNKGLEAGSVKKKLVVQNEGVDLLRLEKKSDGTIEIALAESLTDKVATKVADFIVASIAGSTITFKVGDNAADCNATIGDKKCIAKIGTTSDSTLTVGDGAKKVAIADYLQTLWGTLKTWLEAHTHPTGMGPTGTPLNAPATSWDSAINSGKVKIPDG